MLATRVPRRDGGGWVRGSLSTDLGEEYIRLGFWPIQVPARADLLRPCRRPERPLVRGQIAVHTLARKQASSKPPASHHETRRIDRARAGQQQQGWRRCGG